MPSIHQYINQQYINETSTGASIDRKKGVHERPKSDLEGFREYTLLHSLHSKFEKFEQDNAASGRFSCEPRTRIFATHTAYILLWITTVVVCILIGKVNEIRHLAKQAEEMLMRTEDMVTDLYQECV